MQDNNSVQNTDVQIEFLEKLLSINKIEMLQEFVLDFLTQKFKLSNCFITINEIEKYKINNQALVHTYQSLKIKLVANIKSMRSNFTIKNPTNDFILKEIKDIDKIPSCITTFPLISNKEFLGCIICYSETSLEIRLELLIWLCEKISTAIKKIKEYENITNSALTDSLTGLYNRVYFDAVSKNSIITAQKENKPTSLILFDIDNFKTFNDSHGHMAGDVILSELGKLLTYEVPPNYTTARYGGEEFMIFLPQTDNKTAIELCEKINKKVQQKLAITISIGLVTCMNSSAELTMMIKEADIALYKAKSTGKNKTCQRIIVDKNLAVVDAEEAQSFGKT